MPCPERGGVPRRKYVTQMSCWMRIGVSCIEIQQECTSILTCLSRIHLSQIYADFNSVIYRRTLA